MAYSTVSQQRGRSKLPSSAIAELGNKAVTLQLDAANTKTFDKFVWQVKQSLQTLVRVCLPDDIGGALAKRAC